MSVQPVPLPHPLSQVPRPVLEDYVGARVKQFSRVFAGVLLPSVTEHNYDLAFSRTLQLLGSASQEPCGADSYALRFTHKCRFLGCMRKECVLCKNNPNKKCREDDNLDDCYADGQVLKSKCEADVYLELINLRTGQPEALPSVEIAVSVVDGESYSEANAGNYGHVKELLKNDDDSILLGAYQAGSKTEADGRLYLRMTDGQVKLPDLCVNDKNDTFHLNNETFGTFRLMARAVQREGYGQLSTLDNVRPTVSGRFIVKTQRALNDYRKSDYPHFKDELTKLKHIGSITAQRLREIQSHLPDCPYSSIETVEQLKQLMAYADQNRQVENKMLDLLNMKGKHKHKWDYLREVLSERVVYDDMLHRLWYCDDSCTQGVLFSCKQGQINMDRPIGLAQRAGNGRLVVNSSPAGQEAEILKQWRGLAETAWHTPGHRGWTAVQEQLDMVNSGLLGAGSMSMAQSMSMADQLDDPGMLAKRGSVNMSHPLMMGDSARSRRSSAVSYPGPNSPELAQAQAAGMSSGGLGAGMGSGMYSMQSGGPQQQQSSSQGQPLLGGGGGGYDPVQAGGQPAFQFTGGRPGGVMGMGSGLLPPDVGRTGSAPNLAATSPLFSHKSMDSSAGPGPLAQPMASASHSGPHSGPLGAASGLLDDPSGGTRSPRSMRNRRMSADMSAARQMAMMQAGMQPGQDMSADLTGKRVRNSAPGPALLDELQQLQQQHAAQGGQLGTGMGMGMGMQQQQGGMGRPPALTDYQLNMVNRHALYHFESRGRHTPRSRLNESVSDTVGATALGSVLDPNDIEAYLAQNFSFITNEPTYPSGPVELGSGSLAPGGGASAGPAPSPNGLSSPLMNMSLQQQLQSEQLTGQMQHGLILNDMPSMGHGSGSMGPGGGGDGGGQSGGLVPGMFGGMQGGRQVHHQQWHQPPQQQHQLHEGMGAQGPQGYRELKRSESDSFKRFLTTGLTFSPLEATPEEQLFEGIRRDSTGLID